MATDNLMPQNTTSKIKQFMLRSSSTGLGLTGKTSADFTGKYNINGGTEVTLSFSPGTAGDAYSSGKIVPLGLGKYAWHVPNVLFETLGDVLGVLSVSGAIDEKFSWEVVVDNRTLATKPVNVTQFGGTNGTFASGRPEVRVASMADNTLTAAAIAPDAGAELAALVETYIVNEGDATAVLQAVADKIAQDWIAGDASPVAVATAVWSVATRTITGGSLTTSPPTAGQVADAVWDEARSGHVTAGTFGEKVNAELDSSARVKLAAEQPDYAPATAAALTAMRGADNDTLKTLSDQIDGIDGGGAGLTGPYTRTITVTDSADDAPIEAAKVRLYRTGETETKPTEADGQVEFTTEAATFSYAVTANGYGGKSGTIVISANGSTTIELTATAVTPPTDPALSAIEVLCLNANFAAASGISIDFRMASVATGDQNRAHPGAKKTITSNASGIARFEGPQGATIEWKRGTGQQWTAVTLDNDSVTNVTSLIGSP